LFIRALLVTDSHQFPKTTPTTLVVQLIAQRPSAARLVNADRSDRRRADSARPLFSLASARRSLSC
jgi:hypothetical protein